VINSQNKFQHICPYLRLLKENMFYTAYEINVGTTVDYKRYIYLILGPIFARAFKVFLPHFKRNN